MSKVIPINRRYGASPEQWERVLAGPYVASLLPVVCNPNAVVSPGSKLKALGKVPSRYSQTGVVGIAGWNSKITTLAEAQNWARNPDYGICLQCRDVPAIDADITDTGLANAVYEHIVTFLDITFDVELPKRYRSNSPKFLLAFELHAPGEEYTKRKIKTEHGYIEFLAKDQQFVAAGTHVSGVPYQWDTVDGLTPLTFPVLDAQVYEALFDSLQRTFGVADPDISNPSKKLTEPRKPHEVPDPIADHLEAIGRVISIQPNGAYNIVCPFKEEHSGDSGETETQYFPHKTGGFELGNFRCMHAHCEKRTREDFLNAVAYEPPTDFDDETPPPPVKKTPDFVLEGRNPETLAECLPFVDMFESPDIKREGDGRIKATSTNMIAVLSSPKWCGHGFAFDTFRKTVMVAPVGTNEWRPLKDTDYQIFKSIVEEAKVVRPSYDEVRRSIHVVADRNAMDSATLWINTLKWDGVPRIANFLHRYTGALDNAYTRACSLYMWTALVGRQLEPGTKAEMAVILVGPQGAMKTSTIHAMVPQNHDGASYCAEMDLGDKDGDNVRVMRGKMIIEISELRGLRTREANSIKSFIAAGYDDKVPKYVENSTQTNRRCIFVGTTNDDEFLCDPTGERRWLPVDVTRCDPDAVKRDRTQLWAEARDYFNILGVLYSDAEKLAKAEHGRYSVKHEWTDLIIKWLLLPSPDNGTGMDEEDRPKNYQRDLSDLEIVEEGIGLPGHYKGYRTAIKQVMTQLGFVKERIRTLQGMKTDKKMWRLKGNIFPNELKD